MKQQIRQSSVSGRVLRVATLDDKKDVMYMAQEAMRNSQFGDEDFIYDKVWDVLRTSIEHPKQLVLLCYKDEKPVGIFHAFIEQSIFNFNTFAREGVWYVKDKDKKSALLLFKAFRLWAKQLGAVKYTTATHSTMSANTLGAYYERQGLRPFETHYWGNL